MAEYKVKLEFKMDFPNEYENMNAAEREGLMRAEVDKLFNKPSFTNLCPIQYEFRKEDDKGEITANNEKRVVVMGRVTARGKVMLVIEDQGLSANGFGPMPWDCVSGARTVKVLLDKGLYISISNVAKLNDIFGEENVYKKVATIRKTGERVINVDLQLCELNGIDPEALINERARGHID